LALLVILGCSNESFVSDDASTDAIANDVTSDVLDASEAGDGCAPPPICSQLEDCASFDDGTYGPFASSASSGAMVSITSAERVSCPNGLMATIASNGASNATLYDDHKLGTSPTTAHPILELDVFLPSSPPAGLSFFSLYASVNTTSASEAVTVLLASASDGWYLSLVSSGSTKLTPPPRVGAWNHMKLDVTFNASTSATLTYDRQDGLQGTAMLNEDLNFSSITATGATVGVATAAAAAATTAYYDNIVFTPP